MPTVQAKIATWSNNPQLQSLFVRSSFSEQLRFEDYKNKISHPYVCVVIDLEQDLNDLSQKIISIYEHCRKENQKLAVVLFHGEKIDTEKNLYFTQLLDQLGGSSPLHRFVIAKDIYSEDLLDSETWLEKYILESLLNKKIQISSKGENKIYPLTIRDFIHGLQKTLFLSGTSGKVFWLTGDPFNDLDLAYLINKNLEDSEDHFEIEAILANTSTIDLNSLGNQSRASLNWEPVDDFSLALKKAVHRIGEDKSLLLSNLHRLESSRRHPKLARLLAIRQNLGELITNLKIKKSNKKIVETSRDMLKRGFEVLLITVALIYLLITLSFISFTSLSLANLEKSLTFARSGDITGSVKSLKKSLKYAQIGESSYNFVSPVFSSLAPDFHEKNHNLFVFLGYSQSSLENLQQTNLLAEKIYQSIGNAVINLNYDDASLALRSNLSQVYENINQIHLLTKNGKLPEILENKLNESQEFKNISLVEQQVTQLLKSVELVPAFLAGEGTKNIVVLFQNSLELRSTGGVVDYLATLVLDHGRVVSRNIYTSNEIDSLITGTITAPPLIAMYTGSEKWKTRDLNYNPDYNATASNFSAIIYKALKFKPDIIVAVNQSLISRFLQEDRGIVLNGQNITSESFENDLPRISPSPIYRQLIDYYFDQILGHKLTLVSFSRVIAAQSMENQLLFWTADNNVEKSIIDQSFSGAVFPHSCHPAVSGSFSCLSETTYLNESNFSLVPVGNNLKKKVIHKVSFVQTGINHEYDINYKFTTDFPNLNRDLIEVIQVYAPASSSITRVSVNGKALSLNSIQKQQDNLLERFQIPLSLKFNADNQVLIDFTSPITEPIQLPFAYSLTEYQQGGISSGDSNIELSIKVPETARVALITSPATSSPDGYTYVYPPITSTFGLTFEPKEH